MFFRIPTDRLQYIANSICLIFPKETKSCWFSPARTGADGGVISRRGALVDKLKQLKEESVENNIIKPSVEPEIVGLYFLSNF